MYARVTRYQADPSRMGEMEVILAGVKAKIQNISGAVAIYNIWRSDGHGVVTAIYVSRAAAEAASDAVQAIWQELAGVLQGAPSTETYDHVVEMIL